MKKLFIFLLTLSISFQLYSQKSDSLVGRDKKTESKISFIQYKFTSGEYSEAIQNSKGLLSKLDKKSELLPSYKVQAKLLQAYSYYASLQFDKANAACKEAVSFIESDNNSNSKFESYLYLATYLQDTDNLVSSAEYLKKAESLISAGTTKRKKFDLTFSQAKNLIKQGFLNEAMKLLDEQTSYRLEMASMFAPAAENIQVINNKNDFKLRKEKYAELINLKIASLISEGMFTDAQTLIANNKVWIGSNLGQNHILYRELLKMQGEMSLQKKDYSEAASIYSKAYQTTTFPEYEQNKIDNLSKLTIASIYAKQTVDYTNYLRRLEMYAFRSVGFLDRFQLAYEYSESYKSFIQGDFSGATSRLNRLAENFNMLPESHPWNINIIQLKAAIAEKKGDVLAYKDAIVKLSGIKQKYYGSDCPVSHQLLLSLAMYEIHYGKDFASAEKIMQNSYNAVIKKELTRESGENVYYLTSYAELFAKTGRYDSAMTKAAEAVEISKSLYKEKSAEYLLRLAEYTDYQIQSGKYKEGFENLQKLSDLSESIKSGDTEILQKAYMTIAKLYTLKGDFDRSKSLLNKAYSLTQKGPETQELAEAEASEQRASLYLLTGNYSKAEKLLLKSIEIKENKLEKNSPLVIHGYQEMARLNLTNGNYAVSEQYLKKATETTEAVFGNKSLKYGECLLIYADYYIAISDYKKAEDACTGADDIEVKKWGKNNLRRAEILAKLALIRSKMTSYKSTEVEKLYAEAGTIIKNSVGTDNPLYVNLTQKQAEFYIGIDKSDKADQLLTDAQKFWTAKLGSENKYNAEIELLRGNIAYAKSKYDQAEKNYSKAKSLYGSIFDDNHPSYIHASGKLARVYYMQKHPDRALTVMEEIIPKYLNYVVKYFPSLSFREKTKFWNNIKEEFEFYNFIVLSVYPTEKPKLASNVYNNIISTKALLLSSNIKIKERILSSNDSTLVEMYNEWVSQKEYLTNILSLTKQQLADQNIDVKFIEGHIEKLEKEMSNRSEHFSGEEKKKDITWKDIQEDLYANEYAVEIVRTRYFNKQFTDSAFYAALIINEKTGDYPDIVIFPNGKLMEKKYFKIFRNSAIMKVKDETSYNAYWKPLKSKIPDGSTVYLSSDGVFNQLNVEMMLSPEGDFVIDKNSIVYVTNTKDLLNKTVIAAAPTKKSKKESKKQKVETANYVLCGNPGFYTGEVNIKEKSIPALPGAEQEVLDLNNLLTTSGKTTTRFLNNQVTEDTLKALKNPYVFHIATHGFFKESSFTNDDDPMANPLLNSGLVLYGGGDILNHPENNYVNMKDGILTAYEAMNLNFDNTPLVVLSACETGRGEVQAGEGVYGLQRSFLIAGADAVIMSLFKVNDEVTQKLMLSFYKKWLATGDKRRSFIDAKREIKKEYGATVYWGAFVMIEGKVQDSTTPAQ